MGVLLAGYGCWQVFQWTPRHRSLFGDLWFYPVVAVATWSAWRASVRCAHSRRLRVGWRLIAFAMLVGLFAEVAQTVYELAGQRPYPSIADVLYLLFYVVLLAGVLALGIRQQAPGRRMRLSLDLAIIAVGGSIAVWYVVLGPTAMSASPSVLQAAFSIAYPVGDMVLLLGLASVLLRESAPSTRRALRFIAAGLVLYVAGDLVYDYITLHGTYHGGDPVDTFYIVALALFAVAGAAQTAAVGADVLARRSAPRASWAPYVALAFGLAILLAANAGEPFFPQLSVAVTVAVLVVLVAARQHLAQRELVRMQRELAHRSMHDALTGLPNRALVLDRAEQMLARAQRRQTPATAMYVDLDGFKHVNDTFGHAAGDELLVAVAQRMLTVVRDGDTVGRMGGDEFVVLLDDASLDGGSEIVAQRLLDAIGDPFELASVPGQSLSPSASIGIAVKRGAATADDLLREADYALYGAKAAGRNRYVNFESKMETTTNDRITIERDLWSALDREELFLLYQPTVELATQTVTGVEALVRWRHPTRGVISPVVFIPMAEDSGLIVPIGRWVLREACRQAAAWSREGRPLALSVNVSARQLDDETLVDDVEGALAANGLDPASLTLEITETALMHDPERAAQRLRQLKAIGVRIAIDDFGVGYSALGYLRVFPVDMLKIDRSFIAGIETSAHSRVLIHTLVQLAKTLGLQTLGEGIETATQLDHLQGEQCDLGQGFLFARPLAPEHVQEFLTHSAEPADAARI